MLVLGIEGGGDRRYRSWIKGWEDKGNVWGWEAWGGKEKIMSSYFELA